MSDIRHEFGDEVATLVDGASEPEELINAACADKLANIRDIIRDFDRLGDGVWDIFNASKDSVAWYYISMLDAFGNGDEGICLRLRSSRNVSVRCLGMGERRDAGYERSDTSLTTFPSLPPNQQHLHPVSSSGDG